MSPLASLMQNYMNSTYLQHTERIFYRNLTCTPRDARKNTFANVNHPKMLFYFCNIS